MYVCARARARARVCVCVCVNGTYCCSADVDGSNGRNCWSQHSTEGCRTDVEAPVESHSMISLDFSQFSTFADRPVKSVECVY